MNIIFKQWNCLVIVSKYLKGGFPAIYLIDANNGEQIAKATVNLIDYGIEPEPNHCYLKDYSENQGIVEILAGARVVIPIQQIRFGNLTATLCKLSPQLIEELEEL
ncbi:hypothetical protein [Microcystis sp. LEGE 08355]|uniref:hypothetical protein n=1 Tax=Microcystis sp. LEGE 08355 TaxID=1828687 RepID=UPI001882CC95|nr:hypothetical protein [Microcystis sp. LEGE 08355]MBE9071226.1 hypothetical protein [Microcystis sp. LEGE 08355]